MSISFELNATVRGDMGKGASRRLRRAEQVPGVIYGSDKAPLSLTFSHAELVFSLANEAFYSHVLTIKIEGQEPQQAILKAVQRHPFKPKITHIDLLRVDDQHQITTHVPLHFLNEDKAVGVKKGGKVVHLVTDVEVSCFPGQLPEFIEVDLLDLDVSATVHLSDLKLAEGLSLVELNKGESHDVPVVTILPKAGGSDAADE